MVLLGMVPVLMHTPPTALCFSTNATRFPAFTAWIAARCPPGPEPITISSYGCIYGVLFVRFVRGANSGVGLNVIHSINESRGAFRGRARVGIARRNTHQMFL